MDLGQAVKGRGGLLFVALVVLCALPASADAARVDRSFGSGGIAKAYLSSAKSDALPTKALAQTADGRILVLGNEVIREWSSGSTDQMVMARFSARGRLDRGFGRQGLVYGTELPAKGRVNTFGFGEDFALTKNKSIVVTGPEIPMYSGILNTWTSNRAFVARLLENGQLDGNFGRGGRITQRLHLDRSRSLGLNALSIDLSGKGKILVGGEVLAQRTSGPFVARFNVRGTLDRSLRGNRNRGAGERGVVQLGPVGWGQVAVVRSARRGGVIAAGSIGGKVFVSKLKKDGTRDFGFANRGTFLRDLDKSRPCWCSEAADMAFDRAGRIIVVGSWSGRSELNYPKLVVFRLLRNGRLDRSFGNRGILRPKLGANFKSTSVALQHDGKIVVGGAYSTPRDGKDFSLVRITPAGRLDRSFFKQGVFVPKLRGLGSSASDVIVDSRGRILASGDGSQYFPVIRIHPG